MPSNSVVVYDGPSMLDRQRIIVIMTRQSANPKTANMVQTWILCAAADPITANRNGSDVSICGNCPLRGTANPTKARGTADARGCYVSLIFGPSKVWKAWQRGKLDTLTPAQAAKLIRGRMLRLGSYGDPAAVPASVWRPLLAAAAGWTGYTHQSDRRTARPEWLMSSVETRAQAERQWAKGVRTFRVISHIDQLAKGLEVICPASKEGGKRTTCDSCALCSGTSIKARSVAIVARGTGASHALARLD